MQIREIIITDYRTCSQFCWYRPFVDYSWKFNDSWWMTKYTYFTPEVPEVEADGRYGSYSNFQTSPPQKFPLASWVYYLPYNLHSILHLLPMSWNDLFLFLHHPLLHSQSDIRHLEIIKDKDTHSCYTFSKWQNLVNLHNAEDISILICTKPISLILDQQGLVGINRRGF